MTKKTWVVSYGTKSLDNRSEVLCCDESESEVWCNVLDKRFNPETIYVFTRPDDKTQDAYFWKGGEVLVNGK
tara:strand:- start:13447 stop:13662 length:216 start_codon:yes stop_codon:yes gene_type:complete